MATTTDRTALRRNVHRSRWLTELCQRADSRISEWERSGLNGDQKMAIDACKHVVDQARTEANQTLAEEYAGKQAKLAA